MNHWKIVPSVWGMGAGKTVWCGTAPSDPECMDSLIGMRAPKLVKTELVFPPAEPEEPLVPQAGFVFKY